MKNAKVNRKLVEEYVEDFKLEYPEYDSEMIEEYLVLCDDLNRQEKDLFAELLGY